MKISVARAIFYAPFTQYIEFFAKSLYALCYSHFMMNSHARRIAAANSTASEVAVSKSFALR
jgi:hypothetical protein